MTIAVSELKSKSSRELHCIAEGLGLELKDPSSRKAMRAEIRQHMAKLSEDSPATNAQAESTGYDVTKRAPTVTVRDPKTGKDVKQPVACFGWYFDGANPLCKSQCPHAKPCARFSKEAAKLTEELQEIERAEDEAAATSVVSGESVSSAISTKNALKAPKAPKVEAKKKKKGLNEATALCVNYEEDWALAVEEPTYRKFYRRVLKRHGDKTITVSDLVDVFDSLGVDTSADDFIADTIKPMVDDGDFVLR